MVLSQEFEMIVRLYISVILIILLYISLFIDIKYYTSIHYVYNQGTFFISFKRKQQFFFRGVIYRAVDQPW